MQNSKKERTLKKESTRHIQELWERAIERAIADKPVVQELSDEKLGEAAGVHIKSGIDASGLWGTTSCTCQACSQICE